jgi:hypothetical protein
MALAALALDDKVYSLIDADVDEYNNFEDFVRVNHPTFGLDIDDDTSIFLSRQYKKYFDEKKKKNLEKMTSNPTAAQDTIAASTVKESRPPATLVYGKIFSSVVGGVYFRSLNIENEETIASGNIYPRSIKGQSFKKCGDINIHLNGDELFIDYGIKGTNKPCNNSATTHIRTGSDKNFKGSRFISLIEGGTDNWNEGFRRAACWSSCGNDISNIGKHRFFVALNTKGNMESGQGNILVDLKKDRDSQQRFGMAYTYSLNSNEVLAIDYIKDPDIILFVSTCVDKDKFDSVRTLAGSVDKIKKGEWDDIDNHEIIKVTTNTCGTSGKGTPALIYNRYMLVQKLGRVVESKTARAHMHALIKSRKGEKKGEKKKSKKKKSKKKKSKKKRKNKKKKKKLTKRR